MTTFERAKKQTLETWVRKLDCALGLSDDSSECGFCKEYAPCENCPIAWANDGQTCDPGWGWYRNAFCPPWANPDIAIPRALAVLIWFHGLKEKDCIRPEWL